MKDDDFIGYVVTADQTHSRRSPDAVPAALEALNPIRTVLSFERTVGDEVQALLDSPAAVVETVLTLVRLGGWHIGIGVGAVETPLPDSTRTARGEAYLRARDAVTAAKRGRPGVAVHGAGDDAETAVVLLATLAGQRTHEGWEVADLLGRGLSGVEAAERLGITPSAVSQRVGRAHLDEVARASVLAARLLSTPAIASSAPGEDS